MNAPGEPSPVSVDAQAAPDASVPDLAAVLSEVTEGRDGIARRELRDFLASVSGFRSRHRSKSSEERRKVATRVGLVATCCLLAVGGLVAQTMLQRAPSELPIQLQGAWVTTAKDYADRGFWIGKHQVAFRVGAGAEDIQVFSVVHITEQPLRADTTVYDIEYGEPGATVQWSFKHAGLPHPGIVFTHQPQMTWTVKPDLHPPVR